MPAPPTAADLGLMQGYPAPPEQRVTKENARRAPFNRWSFQHMRELGPTAEVWRGDGPVAELEERPLDLDDLAFDAADGARHTLAEMLDAACVDATVVLHDGRLVWERYRNGMRRHSQHLLMSVTKSLVGTLAEQLAHEGLLDPTRPVTYYVPELRGSAWNDATVRHALDMTTGVRFDETYDDPASDISRYGYATGSRAAPAGYDGPRNMAEALPTLQPEGVHGHAFHYVSPNTDVVGWVIARVTGQPFSVAFGERIWSQLGAERDAYVSRDPIGMEMVGGSFNATARDLARFGQMVLDDGACNGRQVIAPAVVAGIRAGGDRDVFARGTEDYGPLWRGWSYRAFWWHTHNPRGAFTGVGIHGQYLYLDPAARLVIAQFASYPTPLQPDADAIVLPAFAALAQELGNARA